MASDLIAAVISDCECAAGERTIVATDTTSLISFDNPEEAHYVCALLNSRAVRGYIRSFSSAGRGFGSPSVIEHVAIPKFESADSNHVELGKWSIKAHRLVAEDGANEKALAEILASIDNIAKEIWNLRDEELSQLQLLAGSGEKINETSPKTDATRTLW